MKPVERRTDTGIRDALNCCSEQSGPNHQVYGRGMFVGVVSGLMGAGYKFDTAYARACRLKPKDFDPACDPWLPDALTPKELRTS